MIAVGEMSSTAIRSVGHAPAAIVPRHGEAGETQRLHDLDLILRHRPLRVGCVLGVAYRFSGVTVTAQVGTNDGEMRCEARCNAVPHRVGLRIAMQEQQRRPAAANDQIDFGAGGAQPPGLKVGEKGLHCRRSTS
jgi:hypothetical protein